MWVSPLIQRLCSYNWGNANSGVFIVKFEPISKDSYSAIFLYFIHHQFVHFIDLEKTLCGLMSSFVHFIHLYMNPLPFYEDHNIHTYSSFCLVVLAVEKVTNLCRDGWNVWNCSSSHVQVFGDRRSVQIGDEWHEQNWSISLIMNTPEFALSQMEEHKLCFSDETHVDFIFLVVQVVFVWLVVWYVWFIKLGCIRCRCGMKENILYFVLSPLFGIHEISYAISLKIRL